jgi:hypothetical protein
VKSRSLLVLSALALASLGIALGYLMRPDRDPLAATPAPAGEAVRSSPAPAAFDPLPAPSTAASTPASPLRSAIDRLLDLLERHAASAADLKALRAALLAADPEEAFAAIRGFLRTGRNADTGQEFTVGPGGVLSGSPTLRLLLLDVLGQIARKARSDVAAQVARETLSEKTSSDEWALALRNLAWTEPNSRLFLADKMREMLAYEPWRSAPSGGLLEAMDVIVFTKDASLIPDLAEARAASNELSHAADIALDRLAEAAPLDVLTYLNTHPSLLGERPFLRADYFAKADLSQGAQRNQIEVYLGRPDISLDEKSKLLKALVTPSSFVSDSLVTAPVPPDDGSARRAALTITLNEWLTQNRFPTLRVPLLETQQRLSR